VQHVYYSAGWKKVFYLFIYFYLTKPNLFVENGNFKLIGRGSKKEDCVEMAPPYNSVRIEADPPNGYEFVWLHPKGDLKLLYLEFESSA